MSARLGGLILMCLLIVARGQAATCPPYTYTLVNGTTVDANAVMGNFNSILNCANTSLAPVVTPAFLGGGTVQGADANTVFLIQNTNSTASRYPQFQVINYTGGFGGSGAFNLVNSRGSGTSPAPVQSGDGLGFIGAWGQYDTTSGHINNAANIVFYADQSFTSSAAGGAIAFVTTAAGTTTNTERMRINSSGNVGIGTSTPGYTLQVNGSAAGSSAWINLSDARLKTNVETISGALDIVKHLRGVRFQWLPDNKRESQVGNTPTLAPDEVHVGFIAQEVEAVAPEAVVPPKKKGAGSAYYGLKEADLIPFLVEAIKEQQAEIEQLHAMLASRTYSSQ